MMEPLCSVETFGWDMVLQFMMGCSSFWFNESHASLQMVDVLSSVIMVWKDFTEEMCQARTSSGFENSSQHSQR